MTDAPDECKEYAGLTQAAVFDKMRVVWQLDLYLGPLLAARKAGAGDGQWVYRAAPGGGLEVVAHKSPMTDLDVSRLIAEDAARTARRLSLQDWPAREAAAQSDDAAAPCCGHSPQREALASPRPKQMLRSALRHDALCCMGCEICKSRRANGHVDTTIVTPGGVRFRSYVSALRFMQRQASGA